jgi:hypothetical protein
MNATVIAVIIAAVGASVTVGSVIYLAGRMQGSIATRLDDIERRLEGIEGWLGRLGVTTLRKSDLPNAKR